VPAVLEHPPLAGAGPNCVDGHVAGDDGRPSSGRAVAAELPPIERHQNVDQRALHEVLVLGVATADQSAHDRVDGGLNILDGIADSISPWIITGGIAPSTQFSRWHGDLPSSWGPTERRIARGETDS